MLSFCANCCSLKGGLLVLNEAALKDSLTNMQSFVGGVGSLVADGVARCQEKVQQHKDLCPKNKEILLQLLVRS